MSTTTPPTRRAPQALITAAVCLVLAGCAGTPTTTSPGRTGRTAPPAPMSDLDNIPDAEPRVEMIRTGGPNKPYTVMGQTFVPLTADVVVRENGIASWYGGQFHGAQTASGEVYNMYAMTAAHPTLPIPSYARVRNPSNGREVIVRINDRGPFVKGRIIDLSFAAATRLGTVRGVAPVEIERLTNEEIRRGSWKRDPAAKPLPVDSIFAAATPKPVPEPILVRPPVPLKTSVVVAAAAAAPAASAPLPPINPPLEVATEEELDAATRIAQQTPPSGESAASAPAEGDQPVPITVAVPRLPELRVQPVAPLEPAKTPTTQANASSSTATASVAVKPAKPLPPPVLRASGGNFAKTTTERLPNERALTTAARGWWLQLGAFHEKDGATAFHGKLAEVVDWLAPLLALFNDRDVHKVQVGPYETRDEASKVAQRLREQLQIVPMLVERR